MKSQSARMPPSSHQPLFIKSSLTHLTPEQLAYKLPQAHSTPQKKRYSALEPIARHTFCSSQASAQHPPFQLTAFRLSWTFLTWARTYTTIRLCLCIGS